MERPFLINFFLPKKTRGYFKSNGLINGKGYYSKSG